MTPVGLARLTQEGPPGAGALVLGHGAGGGTQAPDLLAARAAGLAAGLRVVMVEQPWLVRGGRVAEAPVRLDAAWLAVLASVDGPGPLVVGGRSSGARVACRTASEVGATAVLALAFPLRPPARPDRSRLSELLQPVVPRLVVQGERDAFGRPEAAPGLEIHLVHGADHGFGVRQKDGRTAAQVAEEVRLVVAGWLSRIVRTAQTLT